MASKYPYFMESHQNHLTLTWTNTGGWDNTVCEYDIISIVENTKQQLLQSINDTEAQLNKLKEQLNKLEEQVGVTLCP
jgi:hypothetical protein